MPAGTAALKSALADRYEIERQVGEGGMATVYLARDVKHNRKVAVKVLRPELAAVIGADRFLAEIETTASLQHPHILPLHDSGEVNGTVFYVMPYIEGESLRDRLSREKHLPVEQAMRITRDVAGALDYAHRNGVIHRDIKPENVLLHDGQALVADFGIALAASSAGGTRMTETGMSLGTPHYMSPEQAMGERDLDARSDIYALGVMLYEMLVGDPPFTGSTAQAIVAKVVTATPPPLAEQRPTVPPNVEAAVLTALQKLPADRFTTAGDFVRALDDPGYASTGFQADGAREIAAQRGAGGGRWALPVVTCALGIGIGATLLGSDSTETDTLRFTVPVPTGIGFGGGWRPNLALSPDGMAVAYVTEGLLQVRRLGSFEPDEIARGVCCGPVFSSDGQRLAFWGRDGLQTITVEGGVPQAVRGVRSFYAAADWSERIAYVAADGIISVNPDGSDPVQLTTVADSGEALHQYPHWLPNGDLLYTVIGPSLGWDDSRIMMLDVEHGTSTVVMEQATFGLYTSGYLIYGLGDGSVLARTFDSRSGAVGAAPTLVAESVHRGNDVASMQLAVSETGSIAYTVDPGAGRTVVAVWDPATDELEPLVTDVDAGQISLSPDGARLAAAVRFPNNDDVWVFDLSDGTRERITFDSREDETPLWSPNGNRIAYTAFGTGAERGVWIQEVGSPGSADLVFTHPLHIHIHSWASRGNLVAMTLPSPDTDSDILILDLESGEAVPVAATRAVETDPEFSPDGRWIAYASNENEGAFDVFVLQVDSPENRIQVSLGGGEQPNWSTDGRYLYFVRKTGNSTEIVRVRFDSDSRLARGAPESVLALPYNTLDYAVAPDGRLVLAYPNAAAVPREIRFIRNYFDELKANR